MPPVVVGWDGSLVVPFSVDANSDDEWEIEVTTEAMDLLADRGYDHTYGARPLRRIIQNLIEDPLAEGLLNSRFQAGCTVRVDVEDDLLKLDIVNVPELVGVS